MTDEPEALAVSVTVNGSQRRVPVATGDTLLDMLRWQLGLTGTKECCAEGECGACTVLLDGRAVNACLVLAVEVDGARIVTVEGLAEAGRRSPLQEAFLREGAVQCGFCIPGMLMAAHALLADNPHPTAEEVREGLAGNLCRCAGYGQIVRAVLAAAGGDAA
jgi:aerobic-type carbon monoxide dehydrogenase small subunit (CoxS/CutS family)